MASDDKITVIQSFSDRTLKFGRNAMVAAAIVLVFAWVPAVDLAKSRPFNFHIKQGGEVWIWAGLLVVLLYYFLRFALLAALDFKEWKGNHAGELSKLRTVERTSHNVLDKMRKGSDRDIIENAEEWQARLNAHDPDDLRSFDRDLVDRVLREHRNASRRSEEAKHNCRLFFWRRAYFWASDAAPPIALFGGGVVSAVGRMILASDIAPQVVLFAAAVVSMVYRMIAL